MPNVALNNLYVTIWRGKDCLSFIDGLSSNLVIGLPQNNIIQFYTWNKLKSIKISFEKVHDNV